MLCPGCFSEETESECRSCGYDLSLKRSHLLLPHLSKLNHGRYSIGRLIGRLGGFGVTYLAFDNRLQTTVAIKEYLPRDIAGREPNHRTVHYHTSEDEEIFKYGLTRFLEEARTLAKLDHPNIVRVRDFFEENGTAYLVMDYCQGLTLSEYIKIQPTGRVDPELAVSILIPILDGLREVHQKGFLHRDVKPHNIYLSSDERPILLDFGAARQSMGEKSKSLSVILSEGYAPFEQYQRNGNQGPWTDIYGVAATLYTMVTGEVPPSAMDRIADDSGLPHLNLIPESLRQAIEHGMHVSTTSRTQDVIRFQKELLISLGKSSSSAQSSFIESSPVIAQPTVPPKAAARSSTAKQALSGSYFLWAVVLIVIYSSFSTWMQKKEIGGLATFLVWLDTKIGPQRDDTSTPNNSLPSPPVAEATTKTLEPDKAVTNSNTKQDATIERHDPVVQHEPSEIQNSRELAEQASRKALDMARTADVLAKKARDISAPAAEEARDRAIQAQTIGNKYYGNTEYWVWKGANGDSYAGEADKIDGKGCYGVYTWSYGARYSGIFREL